MSFLVPLRSYNRSQAIRVGGKKLVGTASKYVNVDSPRVQRDLGRHSAIGSIIHAGPSFFQGDDGYTTNGGLVTSRATTLTVDISSVAWVNAAKVAGVQSTPGTATLGAADATNPRIDVVVVDTTTGVFSVIAGTATAGTSLSATRPGAASTFLSGVPAITANKIALAYILLPPTATVILAANVLDVRP